jgi:hypothetical protein
MKAGGNQIINFGVWGDGEEEGREFLLRHF